jgi:flagellin
MAAVLNTNAASLYASKNLQNAQNKMAGSVERLSSGLRINRARDDAAGLGIASSLTSQINSANQGVRNLNDGISLVQTTEGSLAAAIDMAQRIYTLATQGANETLGSNEKTSIQNEMKQLYAAIDGIASRTKYSGITLLSVLTNAASATSFSLQVGNGDVVALNNAAFYNIGTSANNQGAALKTAVDAGTTTAQMQSTMSAAKTYIENLTTQRSLLGAYQNQIEFTVNNVQEFSSNLTAARSNVIDTDYASETAALTKGQILQQAATAMLAQANQMPNVILSLLK